jgi:hypothetical protein
MQTIKTYSKRRLLRNSVDRPKMPNAHVALPRLLSLVVGAVGMAPELACHKMLSSLAKTSIPEVPHSPCPRARKFRLCPLFPIPGLTAVENTPWRDEALLPAFQFKWSQIEFHGIRLEPWSRLWAQSDGLPFLLRLQ